MRMILCKTLCDLASDYCDSEWVPFGRREKRFGGIFRQLERTDHPTVMGAAELFFVRFG